MCAVVFVVNYTWEFNALWTFVRSVASYLVFDMLMFHRRLLPSTTQSRIFFPSIDVLIDCFGPEALPPGTSTVFYVLFFF